MFTTFILLHKLNKNRKLQKKKKDLPLFTYHSASSNKGKRNKYMLLSKTLFHHYARKGNASFGLFFFFVSNNFTVCGLYYYYKQINKTTPHQPNKRDASLVPPPHMSCTHNFQGQLSKDFTSKGGGRLLATSSKIILLISVNFEKTCTAREEFQSPEEYCAPCPRASKCN